MARDKDKNAVQVPPTRVTSTDTATGQALAQDEKEIPTGAERGSQAPGAGEATATADAAKPQGKQAEPAKFASNGSLPHGMLPTPSGPVPASAIHKDKDAADAALEQNAEQIDAVNEGSYGLGGKKLSEATVGRLGRAELQAIAHTRGYEIPGDLGTRGTRNAFLRAQDGDKSLKSVEAGAVYEGRSNSARPNRPATSKRPAKTAQAAAKRARKSSRHSR